MTSAMDTRADRARSLPWTSELVGRFWDHAARSDKMADLYFTRIYGTAVVNFLRDVTTLHGKQVLDYGCGPGYLVNELLQAGAQVTAADYSEASLEAAAGRFGASRGWQGAILIRGGPIDAPDGQFDLITCIETIEHMFEEARANMLREFRRLLKPGGKLLVTVPNEEDLRASFVYCPQCMQEFHMIQHLTSWNRDSMSRLLREGGFEVEFCKGVMLERWQPHRTRGLLDVSVRDVLRATRDALAGSWAAAADAVAPRPFPGGRTFGRRAGTMGGNHLVAVATRT